MTRLRSLALLAAAATLAGCSTLTAPQKPLAPFEVAHAIAAKQATETAFNFEAEVTFPRQEQVAPASATKPLKKELKEFGDLAANRYVSAAIDNVIDSGSLKVTGGMDIPHGRIDLAPQLAMTRRNFIVSVSVPIVFDLDSMSLLIDPAALTWSIPANAPVAGKWARIALPAATAERLKRADLKGLYAEIHRIMLKKHDRIDPDSFFLLEPSEAERKAGAAWKLRSVIRAEQQLELEKEAHQEILHRIPEYFAEQDRDAIRQQITQIEAVLEAVRHNDFGLSGKLVSDILADRDFRMLSVSNQAKLPIKSLQRNIALNVRFFNYDKPVLTAIPPATEVVEVEAFIKQLQNQGETEEQAVMTDAPSTPAQPEAPVSKKARKAKRKTK